MKRKEKMNFKVLSVIITLIMVFGMFAGMTPVKAGVE